jgi:hypothetical protein
MSKLFFITGTVFLCSGQILAQDTRIPRNAVGVLALLNFTQFSGTWGIDYERAFYIKGQIALDIKGTYFSRYETQKFKLLNTVNSEIAYLSWYQAGVQSYFFPSRNRNFRGFFLSAGTSINIIYEKDKYPDGLGNTASALGTKAGFDIGLGGQFPAGTQYKLRWTNMYSLVPYECLSTKLSFLF